MAERVTAPAKLLTLVKMIDEFPDVPATRTRLVGVADIPKPTRLTTTLTMWETEPEVPVTVTM